MHEANGTPGADAAASAAAPPDTLEQVRSFARHAAPAFQLRDDLLNLEVDAGECPGALLPPIYPRLCGAAQTEQRLCEHHELALQAAHPLPHGGVLEALAESMCARQH